MRPSRRAISSTRGPLSVSVSSSKKYSRHFREELLGAPHLGFDALDAAHAVEVAADRLRPQTEGTLRLAAAPGVERQIRMLQVAVEIVGDRQIAAVNVEDRRKRVHVGDDRTLGRADDAAVLAVCQAVDLAQRLAGGDVDARVIELADAHPVDRGRAAQRLLGQHADVRADHADQNVGILFL